MKAPRVSEKATQAQIVHALRTVGATVYVLGTVHRGEPGHMSTRMTPGIPDLCVHLPEGPEGGTGWYMPAHQLWIECKAKGGRLSEAQKGFADFCRMAGVPHLVGGLDEVLLYLAQRGYIREAAHYRLGRVAQPRTDRTAPRSPVVPSQGSVRGHSSKDGSHAL